MGHSEQQKLDAAFKKLEKLPAPPEFAEDVLHRIGEIQKISQPKVKIFKRLFAPKPLAWAALVAMLILVALLTFTNKNPKAPQIVSPTQPESEPTTKLDPTHKTPEAPEIEKNQLAEKMPKIIPSDTEVKTDVVEPIEIANKDVKDTLAGYTSAEGDYVFKTKEVPHWIKNPDAIYKLNDKGLNLVELMPSRRASDFQGLVLSHNNVLPVELVISSENQDQSLDLLKKLFARFKSREVQSFPDSINSRVAGIIPQKNFPQFVSELQNLGSPTTQLFRLSAGDDLKIEITISH